jgi:hypothetical protein
VVDEEFCAAIEPIVDGNKKIVLEETCTQPCPGISREVYILVISLQD